MTEPSRPDLGAATAAPEELFCANHPSVPTILRCNRCGKPICVKCAVLTPVGYRCKECVRGQQSIFYTAGLGDYAIAAIVAVPLSVLAGFLVSLVGGFLFYLLIFAGPLAGGVIADLVHRAVGRRRGRYLWLVVCSAIVLGAVPFMLGPVISAMLLMSAGDGRGGLLGIGPVIQIVFYGVYLVLAVGTAYSRLRFWK